MLNGQEILSRSSGEHFWEPHTLKASDLPVKGEITVKVVNIAESPDIFQPQKPVMWQIEPYAKRTCLALNKTNIKKIMELTGSADLGASVGKEFRLRRVPTGLGRDGVEVFGLAGGALPPFVTGQPLQSPADFFAQQSADNGKKKQK